MSGCSSRHCESARPLPSWAPAYCTLGDEDSQPESSGTAEASDTQDHLIAAMQESLISNLRRLGANRGGPETEDGVQVLMLSGGGQLGAYGAGGLCEWSEDERPEFEVVTGVSTGALIATFAFLGPDYDEVLREAYTDTDTADVLEARSLLCLPFSNSLATTKGLTRLIEHHITADVVQRVAQEHKKGRSLFVGVVELQCGTFIPVNLGEIAARADAASLQEFRDAVLASASIPVVFPPVCLGGRSFVDGGTRQNIFFAGLTEALASESLGRVELYALVNGTVKTAPNFALRDSLLSIGSRSIGLLLDEAQAGSLYRIFRMAEDQGWSYKLASMEVGDCATEANGCTGALVNQFCPEYMTCLFERAAGRVRSGDFWRDPDDEGK